MAGLVLTADAYAVPRARLKHTRNTGDPPVGV
jgi:hypothetical protein